MLGALIPARVEASGGAREKQATALEKQAAVLLAAWGDLTCANGMVVEHSITLSGCTGRRSFM